MQKIAKLMLTWCCLVRQIRITIGRILFWLGEQSFAASPGHHTCDILNRPDLQKTWKFTWHLFSFGGFMFDPIGQLKSLEKSSMLENGPWTRNWSGEWTPVRTRSLRAFGRYLAHHTFAAETLKQLVRNVLVLSREENSPRRVDVGCSWVLEDEVLPHCVPPRNLEEKIRCQAKVKTF